jgi:protocatechuate 3,4-dioxygenase beta subunit
LIGREEERLKKSMTRRSVIKGGSIFLAGGAASALQTAMTGCTAAKSSSASSADTAGTTSSSSAACVAETNVTRGPYFVDNQADPHIEDDVVDPSIPERSDIRSDTKGLTGTQGGLPLYLKIAVGSYSSSCKAIANAQVHVWHCNAQGVYSDVQASSNDNDANLTGENFLRGYQYTDSSGAVSFTTIYPGWYSGRAVHIHVKVRVFDSSGNVTTEATTQLFFDDSTTDGVYAANSEYERSATRDTLNSEDSIYASESPALVVSLTGSATTAYTGTVSLGIAPGTIYGG